MANENRLIDANEFIKRLENTVYDTPTDFGYTPGLVKAVLAQTKTVDAVEVVHGRWMFRKNWDFFVCSECSRESSNYSNYCPNCGAKMDGGETDG